MKSALLQNPGELKWRDVEEPTRGPGEAIVRVLRCGVCGTDIHAMTGKQPFFSYPRRLGHELCVEVIDAPPGEAIKVGDRCAVEPYLFCRQCPACRAGRTNCCRELKVLGVHIDGGHAPQISVPLDKLHVSTILTPDELALVEPLAIGAHGVERAQPQKDEPVLIIGLGPIGLAAAMIAKTTGANLLCIDVQQDRVDFAKSLGLSAELASGNAKDLCHSRFGHQPMAVIDATGSAASMKASFDLPEAAGRLVFLGLFIGSLEFDDPSFHRRELTLLASRAALPGTFTQVIKLIESKQLNVQPLITHRIAFDSIVDELPTIHTRKGLVKAMIEFEPTT